MALVWLILLAASAARSTAETVVCRGPNEVSEPCRTICPGQFCNNSYTSYGPCPDVIPCEPGCDCIENYLRDNEGTCVLNDNCPGPTSENPQPSKDSTTPTPTSSSTSYSESRASASASSYAASQSSTKSSDGTAKSSASASSKASSSTYSKPSEPQDCTYNKCTPTCSLRYPKDCPQESNPCNCAPGTIISDFGGTCVPVQDCQRYINCKGDYNASYTDCPIACPSTCDKPNAEYCNTQCGTYGCACDPGYILSEKNGKCIKPEECPNGYPCAQNQTFVGCLIKCPNSYCPRDDSRGILICDPARPCPSGCGCKQNYLRKSVDDDRCILSSECPPVECTRPNEVWKSCPGPCYSDGCRDRNKPVEDCPYTRPNCQPQCVCKEGFYRNGTNICVTPQECTEDNS